LLKRMEQQGLLSRQRSSIDERKVIVKLTKKGNDMKDRAALIPIKLVEGLANSSMNIEELISLKNQLCEIIDYLQEKNHTLKDE
jgi:MarR family transcriptional regulator, organic hydroperoxide resistance regulator